MPSPPSPLPQAGEGSRSLGALRDGLELAGERSPNLFEYLARLLEDLVVGKAQQRDASTSEVGIAPPITKSAAVVRGAVGLYRETRCCAVEVGEEAADGVLPSEFLTE